MHMLNMIEHIARSQLLMQTISVSLCWLNTQKVQFSKKFAQLHLWSAQFLATSMWMNQYYWRSVRLARLKTER